MKICFASLRKKINYTDTLEYGMDVFYESYRHFVKNNSEHDYRYYNFHFGKQGSVRDNGAVNDSDVIILASVQEFVYYINAMHPRDIEKSQSKIRELFPYLNDKHIILLTQDRAVNKDLILKHTLENQVQPKSFTTIDEMDFTCCLQGLKYHFIKSKFRFPSDKTTDFVYWGSDKSKYLDGVKSGDERLGIIREISRSSKISSTIIGRWPKNIRVVQNWIPLHETLAYLDRSYATLCFNWIDQAALTGRYHEAIACDVFPFVWKNYDSENILVTDKFQRVSTNAELCDKITYIIKRDNSWMEKVRKNFIEKLPTEEEYYKEFDKKITREIYAL